MHNKTKFYIIGLIGDSTSKENNLFESILFFKGNSATFFLVIPYLPPAPEIKIKDNFEYLINSLKLAFENVFLISHERLQDIFKEDL